MQFKKPVEVTEEWLQMLSCDSNRTLRAEMQQDVRSGRSKTSITRYLWPSGRSYRVTGQDITDVPQAYLSCCAGLYASRSEAVSRKAIMGTAFFVEVPQNGFGQPQLYVVTAACVIRNEKIGEGPIIRIDYDNGKFELIATRRKFWQIEDGQNIAIIPLHTRPADFSYVAIPRQAFVSVEFLERGELAVGGAVFLPEGSLLQDEKASDTSLIFGRISKMPEQKSGHLQPRPGSDGMLSVMFRSMHGRPGSPIFLCEPPHNLHFGGVHTRAWTAGPKLLGVYVGPVSHAGYVRSGGQEQLEEAVESPSKIYHQGLLAPIWVLLEMLN